LIICGLYFIVPTVSIIQLPGLFDHTMCRPPGFIIFLTSLLLTVGFSGFAKASPELLKAAGQGDLSGVHAQLAQGADINFTLTNKNPRYGYLVQTALENAASKGHTEVVQLLLEKGASVRRDEWYGIYAATWAGQQGHTVIVLMILAHVKPGADQLNPLFGPAFISAARNNREETVARLLDQGLDPNWHTPGDHFPRPAILEASRAKQRKIFSMLLDAGGDPTPYPQILATAASSGDAKLVNRLITMGMDPNAKNEHGLALSQAACAYRGSDKKIQADLNAAIEVLLEAGSDVNSPAYGRSPLFCAKEHHNEALISLLEAKNAEEFETLGRKIKRAGWGALYIFGEH
jgi:ankyrin repeat protein